MDDYNEFNKFAYFSSSTTVQPPTNKGWDKYHTIRRLGEILVRRRACKGQKNVNKKDDSCTAKVLYVSKAGVCGTLIVPIGTHASTCLHTGHSRSISHQGLDGILGYIGHTRADITHASKADVLEKADGNEVYTLKTDHFPNILSCINDIYMYKNRAIQFAWKRVKWAISNMLISDNCPHHVEWWEKSYPHL